MRADAYLDGAPEEGRRGTSGWLRRRVANVTATTGLPSCGVDELPNVAYGAQASLGSSHACLGGALSDASAPGAAQSFRTCDM